MDKIKNVLHGHKKSQDATHDAPVTSNTTTHTQGTTSSHDHPIYDEMTGHKNDHVTTAPAGASSVAGEIQPVGTAATADSTRPGATTVGKGPAHEAVSEASIKSGVIGFGRDGQEHAAMPVKRSHAVEENLATNQVLGGGNAAPGPNTASHSGHTSVPSQTTPHSDLTSRDPPSTATSQPLEKGLGQDSTTTGTDRSFPLAGGVASKHSTEHPPNVHQPTTTATPSTTTHHAATSEREPGTKEKEAGVRDGQGREGLAAAAGAAAVAAPLADSKQKEVHSQGAETRQATYGDQPAAVPTTVAPSNGPSGPAQSVHPEALAAARAAAGKSFSPTSGFGTQTAPQTTGLMEGLRPATQRTDSRPHIPGEYPTPTPDESKTFLYYRDDLVPEPGAETKLTPGHHGAHDQTIAAPAAAGVATSAGQHELRHTGTLDEPRPRSAGNSDDHTGRNAALAGGLGASAAGLAYAAHKKDNEPTVGGDATNPYSSTALDPRVLGHQNKLDEQRFDPSTKATQPQTHDALQTSNPVGITPPVAGTSHSSSATPTADSTTTTGPVHQSSVLNKLDPRVKEEKVSDTATPGTKDDKEHHHGRDAALVGAGAATGAGVHHALERKDAPGAGTATLSQDSAATSAPPGSGVPNTSAAPASSSPAVAPSTSTAPAAPSTSVHSQPTPADLANVKHYTGPLTTSGTPFYGTTGAPAPREDIQKTPTHQPTATSSTATTGPTAKDETSQHHYGRDAALAGGAAATAGGLAYASQHDDKTDTGPASKTIGPHSSNAANILDPRVQPNPSKQSHHTAGPTATDPASRTIGPHDSNIANILDPLVQPDPSKQKASAPYQSEKADHHYGRDAAVVGGAGAAGFGAYEAAKAYGDHRSTQPGASMIEQRYDPSAPGAKAANPVPAAAHYDYNNEATARNVNQTGLGHHEADRDNTNRNLALGGTAVGAGALGGAAYAGSKHGDNNATSTAHPVGTAHPTAGTQAQPVVASQASTAASHNRYDSVQHPSDKEDHTKRNAALAGTAGVAAAGGAYAYSQQQDADRERARVEQEQRERAKEMEKEQHRLDKQAEKDHKKEEKKLEKEQKKEEKKHAKEEEKEHKKHDKAVAAAAAKEEKKHAKEEEKLEKERQKEAERLEKEREKDEADKKGGILGFLHRDKSKREKRSNESSPRGSADAGRRSLESDPRHSRELGVSGDEGQHSDPNSPRWKGKKLLHKDPPKGHPAREAMRDDVEMKGMQTAHMGTDGEIGRHDAISGYSETRHHVYGAQPMNEISENNKVIEPHTGLPMNVGRFGEGNGGTDANPAVSGHHHVHGGGSGGDALGTQQGHTTNWDAVKKGDTAY